MAFRKERIEKQIEREISSIIMSDVKDERIKFVTITKVALTNDLSIATVFYTVLGTKEQVASTGNVLNEAKGYIKTILSKRLEIRKTPDLKFKYDDSYEQGNKIDAILNEIKK